MAWGEDRKIHALAVYVDGSPRGGDHDRVGVAVQERVLLCDAWIPGCAQVGVAARADDRLIWELNLADHFARYEDLNLYPRL